MPTATSPITAVVFDVGGVLLDWNPRYLYRKLFGSEAEMEHFLATVCTPAWHDPHDRGQPTAGSCAELAEAHPELADLIWAWALRSEEMVGGEVPGSEAVLRELRAAGVPCYGLTNMEAETFPLRRERFTFFSLFDGTVVSGIEGVAKPNHEIFERLLERFGLQAGSTLLIDDTERNLVAAAELGMHVVRFRSADQTRRALGDLGLLPPVASPRRPAGGRCREPRCGRS